MPPAASRKLYIALLGLHPAGFRSAFAADMLQIFDEAAATHGHAWLLADCAASLCRQHLLRNPAEEQAGAVYLRAGLRSGIYPFIEPFELRAERLLAAVLMTASLMLTIFPSH